MGKAAIFFREMARERERERGKEQVIEGEEKEDHQKRLEETKRTKDKDKKVRTIIWVLILTSYI